MMNSVDRRCPKCRLTCEPLEPRFCLNGIPFASHGVDANGIGGRTSVLADDIDRDGDIDITLGSYASFASSLAEPKGEIGWYEQAPFQAGDSNRDGKFDQLDIFHVLASANYLTGEPATWSEGDWNADGKFDQRDIIAALQGGLYSQGPYAAEGEDLTRPGKYEHLRITEINYNPHAAYPQFGERETDDSDDFEFIELTNEGNAPINLDGVMFVETRVDDDTEGIDFTFSAQTLGPGEHIVVVKDVEAFRSRYGNSVRIAAGTDGTGGRAGEYGGRLSNKGERLTLQDKDNAIIQQFDYNDTGGWPGRADGNGSSLEFAPLEGDELDFDDPDNWRSSSEFGGTPGVAGAGPDNRVVFNEILAHTDSPDVDMLELMNRSNTAIDINGWYLADTNHDYLKYKISNTTPVPPQGYQVLAETQFGGTLGALSSFEGEDLWLIEADASGKPVRFVDRVSFGASENGVSFGRWPNGEGGLFPMDELTLGTENTGPKPGEVIISEVHYHPVDPEGDLGLLRDDIFEFVELYNRSLSTVDLSNWRLDGGIAFSFPLGTLINPGQTLVVVPSSLVVVRLYDSIDGDLCHEDDEFDGCEVPIERAEETELAKRFRTEFGVDDNVRLIGPFTGKLDNGGDPVRLEWPDEPPSEQPRLTPWILEDEISYGDEAPWPTSPDGRGDSLARVDATNFGRFAESWTPRTPSPGTATFFVRQAGDANEDGSFDQLDLVLLLHGRKYDTKEPATWEEGDWNGDDVFDRQDVTAALRTGNYLQGPYIDAALTEPSERLP